MILFSLTTVLLAPVCLWLIRTFYRLSLFHPLSHVPGPFLPCISSLWLNYHAWKGDEATIVHSLHQKYGKIVRIGPNAVDIADGEAAHAIYVEKGGFRKPEFYLNFTFDGHRTIFTEIDPEVRAPRAKVLLPIFSEASLRQRRAVLSALALDMVALMKLQAKTGKPVDVLELARSFAADSVSESLFGIKFGALQKNRELIEKNDPEQARPRADGLMDAYDSLGRYWYMPHWLYSLVEAVKFRFCATDQLLAMADVLTSSSDRAVQAAISDKQELKWTYQGRLLEAGIPEDVTRAECQDALFAGIDTTGLNIATVMFYLTKYPEIYNALKREVREQSLHLANKDGEELPFSPYVKAVAQEGLRISRANPTRLPRVVPKGGWHFNDKFFPAGTEVSLSAFELHFNPTVFEKPDEFRPERWLKASKEMRRDNMPFGYGPRRCIGMNLALMDLHCVVCALAKADVLARAKCCEENIEIAEWFNSKVKGGKILLRWE